MLGCVLGCMLGSTPLVGHLIGLPLDIRHVAFASANLGFGLGALAAGDDLAVLDQHGSERAAPAVDDRLLGRASGASGMSSAQVR